MTLMVDQLAGLIGAQPAEIVVHRRRILSWQPSHSWRRTLSPVALGTAAQLATAGLDAGGAGRTRILRGPVAPPTRCAAVGRVQFNGHRDRRLPNTLNVSIAGVVIQVKVANGSSQ
jgi:hypothetical protein